MAFKLRSGNKPSFKMMGSKSPAKQRTIVGENTSEILKDKKGEDYSLALHDTDAGINKGDTIRPGKAPRVGNYIMGGDYDLKKKGDKNYEIKSPAKQKGAKKLDMPDFASPEQVKAKTGGGTKNISKVKIKSPAKSRADRKAAKAAKAAVKGAQAADVGKTGKANRKAAKAAGAAAASGTPMLKKKTKTEYSGVDGKRGKYKKGFYEKETKRGTKGTAVTVHEGSDEARLERYGSGRKRSKDKEISKKRAERIMRRKGKSHK